MIRTERRWRLCTALLIANLVFIWGNSLLPGEISGAFSDWVKDIVASLFPGDGSGAPGGGLLRKLAHFTEFTALGMLLTWRMGMLDKHSVRALALGAGAACVDETIQVFVPGRGPGILDVGIDTLGVTVGILLILIYESIKQKIWRKIQ